MQALLEGLEKVMFHWNDVDFLEENYTNMDKWICEGIRSSTETGRVIPKG